MTNYEKLVQVIQKANPSILELNFGCILADKCGYGYTIWRVFPFTPDGKQGAQTDVCQIEDVKDFKILGRPIRLADVLLAIKMNIIEELIVTEKKDFERMNKVWSITMDGYFEVRDPKTGMVKEGKRWDLLHDNLDHQSEETKQFLIDLLV